MSVTCLDAAPVHLVDQPVVSHQRLDDGVILLDFGTVAFGNLKVDVPKSVSGGLKFHFGEAQNDGRVDRKPPGTVRYKLAEVKWTGGEDAIVAPPADWRNTRHPSAVLTPKDWGVILPFRWVEVEGWKGEFDPRRIVRRSSYLKAWDDTAADFECSDETLNRIWNLCKYSIKATTFAGVYVDGDRERIPYEADAYLNQLSHYYTDTDKQIARDTYDGLMEKPTWPTEWAPHMVFMAHADWMYTGGVEWIKPRYEALKTKLLIDRVGKDGWVVSNMSQQGKGHRKGQRDIVDWPKTERDGYQFQEVNTVVNAFHLEAVRMMADLAAALGKTDDAKAYYKRHSAGVKRFHQALWMPEKGAYRDGIGSDHTAAHATFFPLALGLVPEGCRDAAVKFLKTKDMACSVYAAQYLMEGLFENGAADYALELIVAKGDRSWRHMVESGTTITWEAWDQKYKPNQDWNHAWGAAPGNLLPRYVLGVEPTAPGWKTLSIAPRLGDLTRASGKVPTPHGSVFVSWTRKGDLFNISMVIPKECTAQFSLPDQAASAIKHLRPGKHTLQVQLKSSVH
ncbi:MAG: family 78 glycoside hydrolase catalytic domain [Verrucomicrobiae bacterium]|nr:family 78 glycoside hydrolase catalytic domain [Verrucomicrobiae bacterium]NNJ44300.1 family 78 glycoside hydrolase catalytic domain [Akkermansiaceae bacterium]